MKSLIVLALLLALASCGKNKSGGSSGSSISALSSYGVSIIPNGQQGVVVTCSQANVTNQQRLQVLQSYLNSIQTTNVPYVTINNVQLDRYTVANAVSRAISNLQNYINNNQGQGQYQNQYPGQYTGQYPGQYNQNMMYQCPAQYL